MRLHRMSHGERNKSLWVIIPNTTDQICSGVFLCSYVLTNVQRNSESAFSALSPMKNAVPHPSPRLRDLPKPGVPLLPRQLSTTHPPQNPPNSSGSRVGSGTFLAEGTCQGRTMCQQLFVPLWLCTTGSGGTTLRCPVLQWAPALWESQSDLWRGFSRMAAAQHLQLSDKNMLKWTSCHFSGDIPTAYLSLRPQEIWNLCIFSGHVSFAILFSQPALIVISDSDGTMIPPILDSFWLDLLRRHV